MSEKLHFLQDGMLAGLLLYFTMHDGFLLLCYVSQDLTAIYIRCFYWINWHVWYIYLCMCHNFM